jgi:hypothetical protein
MKPTIEYKNTLFKHKLYQLIPLNALFPRTFLLSLCGRRNPRSTRNMITSDLEMTILESSCNPKVLPRTEYHMIICTRLVCYPMQIARRLMWIDDDK